MNTRIQKWGNSLALRIPKSFADETGLESGSVVEIEVVAGQLVITPVQGEAYELDTLLAKITEANLHREIDTGDAVGNEVS
jgi:antitoxin MazE